MKLTPHHLNFADLLQPIRLNSPLWFTLLLLLAPVLRACMNLGQTVSEAEAISTVKLALNVQQVYWTEHNQFALSTEQLNAVVPPKELRLNASEQLYQYKVLAYPENRRYLESTGITEGRSHRSFTTITAIPKARGTVSSFTGVLIISEVGSMTQLKTEICRMKPASRWPPPIEIPPTGLTPIVQCPAGSQSVL